MITIVYKTNINGGENKMKKITKKLLIPGILILFLITISSANAIDITLDPTDTGGINSAINNISQNGTSDNTITLNSGIYNKNTDKNNNITFNNRNLTIKGIGNVTIDAQNLGRMFNITGNSNITFININFINGNITDTSTISSYGGAILKTGNGTLNIINCTFNNNRANWGGAVYFTGGGDFNAYNSNFTNNIANLSAYSTGGAIALNQNNDTDDANTGFHTYKLINSNFINNTANNNGGAILFQSPNYEKLIEIDYCSFINNSALYGGACSLNGGYEDPIVNNSLFENNGANKTSSGEGGAIEANDNWGLYINNCTFIKNTATRYGGAISNYMSYYTTVINCSFINNTCPMGGAFYDHSSYTRYTNIINSSFTGNDNAILLRGVDATINGCNFTNSSLAINITGNNNNVISSNIINNQKGIFINTTANNNIINYNRIFNNTDYDLNNTGIDTDDDYNWWGNNTPNKIFGITPNNHFIMTVTNLTSLYSNGTVLFNYTFRLNDSSVFDTNMLPYFVTTFYTNVTNEVFSDNYFDARFDKEYPAIVRTMYTNQSIKFIFTTDNEIQTLAGILTPSDEPEPTQITTNNTKGKDGETVNLTARLTDKNGNPLAGKEVKFYIAGKIITAITNSEGIATIEYTINKNDFTKNKLTFTVTFEGDENYTRSNTTGTVTLITEPSPTPTPTPTPQPTPNLTPDNNQPNYPTNNKTIASMKTTGMPINILLIMLFGVLTLVIRRDKN